MSPAPSRESSWPLRVSPYWQVYYCLFTCCSTILVYTKTQEKYFMHLWALFDILQEGQLFLNIQKTIFSQRRLAHIDNWTHYFIKWIDINPQVKWRKIWIDQLCSRFVCVPHFHEHVNFSQKFIKNLSKIAAPGTSMVKANKGFCGHSL